MGALMSAVPSPDEQPLDGLVDRAPVVLVRLVAAQEVEPAARRPPGRARSGCRPSGRPATGRGRRGRRPRCSRGSPSSRLEVDAGRDPPAADRQERQPERAVGAVELEQAPERRPGSGRRPGCRGRGRRRAHFFWCRSMKASRSASGSAESSRRISPTASARRTLRRISWRSFLPSVDEVGLHVGPDREGHDRADVLALDVERPALGHLARPEGRGQRVGRRVAAAQPPQVDDVPRAPVGGLGEIAGERVGDGRQVRGRGQDRRVVGVVRGAEEDRGGGRRDRRQLGRRRRGASWCGAAASPGSTSWRCISGTMRDRVRAGRRSDGTRTSVSSWALAAVRIPPRALEGPAGERGRPRVLRARGHPTSRAGCRRSSGARRARRVGAGAAVASRSAVRTGRLRVKRQGSHARMLHRNPDWLRRQPRPPALEDVSAHGNGTFGVVVRLDGAPYISPACSPRTVRYAPNHRTAIRRVATVGTDSRAKRHHRAPAWPRAVGPPDARAGLPAGSARIHWTWVTGGRVAGGGKRGRLGVLRPVWLPPCLEPPAAPRTRLRMATGSPHPAGLLGLHRADGRARRLVVCGCHRQPHGLDRWPAMGWASQATPLTSSMHRSGPCPSRSPVTSRWH